MTKKTKSGLKCDNYKYSCKQKSTMMKHVNSKHGELKEGQGAGPY